MSEPPVKRGRGRPSKAAEALTITPQQLAQRDYWERLYWDGRVSLEDALRGVLLSGAPATALLVNEVNRAFDKYAQGSLLGKDEKTPVDLAECFGTIRMVQEVARQEAELFASDVYWFVQGIHEATGLPLVRTDPSKEGRETAFTRAARSLGREESTVIGLWAKGRKLVTRA